MRIRLKKDDVDLEFECEPMPESHFRAVLALLAAAIFADAVVDITRLCGLPGAIVTGVATVLTVLLVKGLE